MPAEESRPVQRFTISTTDEAEAEAFIRQMYTGNRTRFHRSADGARFTVTSAEAGGLATDYVRSTIDYSVDLDPFDYFFSIVPFYGGVRITGGREQVFTPVGSACFYPLGVALDLTTFGAGARCLRLPLARLAAVAEETAGIASADLRFDSPVPVSPAMARQWSAFVALASDMLLADSSPAASPLLAEELTRTAAVTALHTFPNTALAVAYQPGPGWVTPVTVRRAAAFIQAHADQPVTLGQIAAAAGISARALQYGFRRYYDTTPTGYLRRVRLEQADAELRAADPGGGLTVAAVARRWGWAKPGQFTASYHQRFGILPSRTLRM